MNLAVKRKVRYNLGSWEWALVPVSYRYYPAVFATGIFESVQYEITFVLGMRMSIAREKRKEKGDKREKEGTFLQPQPLEPLRKKVMNIP